MAKIERGAQRGAVESVLGWAHAVLGKWAKITSRLIPASSTFVTPFVSPLASSSSVHTNGSNGGVVGSSQDGFSRVLAAQSDTQAAGASCRWQGAAASCWLRLPLLRGGSWVRRPAPHHSPVSRTPAYCTMHILQAPVFRVRLVLQPWGARFPRMAV